MNWEDKTKAEARIDFYRCCAILNVSPEDIAGKSRKAIHARPRQVISYWMRVKLKYYLSPLVDVLSRHHSTILHSAQVVDNMRGGYYDEELRLLRENFYKEAA